MPDLTEVKAKQVKFYTEQLEKTQKETIVESQIIIIFACSQNFLFYKL